MGRVIHTKFSRIYVKYIIKNPVLFYAFITLGCSIFLFLTLSVKLDLVKTYKANHVSNFITFEPEIMIEASKVFAYTNRNEKIYNITIIDTKFEQNRLILTVGENDLSNLEQLGNEFFIDIPIGKETLLHRIFIKAGKANGQ